MLEDTGERIIPELMKPSNGMLLEHLARYYFSFPYCQGDVLDIACGSGYGAFMIAKSCKKRVSRVMAVDRDQKTLDYAMKTYHHPLITYQQADALKPQLASQLGRFDAILSFETIEHLDDEQLFIHSLYSMLKPGGKLIISTPFGQGRGKPTREPFHVHQLTRKEFVALFRDFDQVEMYYQLGVAIEKGNDMELPRDGVHYPIGIAVCEKKTML